MSMTPFPSLRSTWSDFLLLLYGDKDLPSQFATAIHLLLAADEDGSYLEPMIRTFPSPSEMNVGISWDQHDHMRAVINVPGLAKLGHDIQACMCVRSRACASVFLQKKDKERKTGTVREERRGGEGVDMWSTSRGQPRRNFFSYRYFQCRNVHLSRHESFPNGQRRAVAP